MGRLFHPESPLMRFLENVADLILLNLLWLVCCIPVVTIGPATTAMCSVTRDMARENWPPVFKTFFREFKGCFKQGLQLFFALLIPVVLAVLYLMMAVSGGIDNAPLLKYLSYVAAAFIGFVCSYVFPLAANFDNTTGHTLKNAVLLPLANPILAVIVTALNFFPVILYLCSPALAIRLALFWGLIGCALTSYINMKLLGQFFSRLTPPENRAE